MCALTSQVNNGSPSLSVLGDLSENLEGANLALGVAGLQQVNEQVQPPRVPDGQLRGFLAEVKVHQQAKGNHRHSLIANLQDGVEGWLRARVSM